MSNVYKCLLVVKWTSDRKQLLKIIIGLIISFFFGYVLYVNWRQLASYEWNINYYYLVLAFIVFPINLVLSMFNWHLLVACIGGQTSFYENMEIYCYSNLPKNIPGAIWYVVGRAYWYKEKGVSHTVTILATTSEIVYLIVSGFFIIGLALPFSTFLIVPDYVALFVLLLVAPFLNASLFNKLIKLVQTHFEVAELARFTTKDILLIMLNYSLVWVWGSFIVYLLINGVDAMPFSLFPDIILACALSVIANLATTFILNGMGVREVTMVLLLNYYLPLQVAIVVSILFKLLVIVGELFWSVIIIGLFIRNTKPKGKYIDNKKSQ